MRKSRDADRCTLLMIYTLFFFKPPSRLAGKGARVLTCSRNTQDLQNCVVCKIAKRRTVQTLCSSVISLLYRMNGKILVLT